MDIEFSLAVNGECAFLAQFARVATRIGENHAWVGRYREFSAVAIDCAIERSQDLAP
jgi:hypothetical protein